MLRISELRAGYGSIVAIDSVSLEVAAGELVTVLGTNGAGKSTLLLTVCGIVRPKAGEIEVDGRSVVGLPPEEIVAAGVSLVPEQRRVFHSLTVEENLLLGAVATGTAHPQREVKRALDRFSELVPLRGRKARMLSGGEQQQLVIARALLTRPRLLLLDEPSLGLAPLIVSRVFEAIATLREEGLTIVLVEQQARRAIRLADRCYVLAGGRVVGAGSADEVAASGLLEAAYMGA